MALFNTHIFIHNMYAIRVHVIIRIRSIERTGVPLATITGRPSHADRSRKRHIFASVRLCVQIAIASTNSDI